VDGVLLADAGFGGQDLEHPNFDTNGSGFNEGFGNGTFSPPPLIEAADTGPFFHNAFRFQSRLPDDIEEAVNFYRLPNDAFGQSLGGKFLQQRFGTPLTLTNEDSAAIARFLRVLNTAFNIDIAKQRLQAASTLVTSFGDTRADIQKRLMELAVAEVDDALDVTNGVGSEIYPNLRILLSQAKDEVALGLSAASSSQRQLRIANALSRLTNGRGQVGSGINFQLGQGNLMF